MRDEEDFITVINGIQVECQAVEEDNNDNND